ncbi:putative ankyrin repeat protein [Zancudomyces culisetae]|uniref:Putative ankyrin repeat protein n=1 Tax=Zancudomyces culisetae TaxID=1213189 RepID=A0A1R1PXF8_ZANCU|nr:putative ankyrin repeat protein [Zancudomyces culisetae]|eukprot:OMH85634.1 putative ankyrin repeat protein [Zancudomyces culisetae]
MYVVIDRSTSTVVHMDTLFMNEGEYLDIDIGKLFSEYNESRKEETDMRISDSLYIRPLIRVSGGPDLSMYDISDFTEENNIEMLIDICETKFEFSPEICGSVGRDTRCVNARFMTWCILVAVRESCMDKNLKRLKKILNLERDTNLPFHIPLIDDDLCYFISDYEYEDRTDLLIYTLCTYYAIDCNMKEFMLYLEENYTSSRHLQIFFDVAVFHSRESLVKKYLFKVKLNPENIAKITEMAYDWGYVNLIRLLLSHSDKLEGDLDENALKTAIKNKDYELAQEIITKYPNTVDVSCIEEAVKRENIMIANLLIKAGVDLKSPVFKGIKVAVENNNMDMLRLLLENGASIERAELIVIGGLYKDKIEFKTSGNQVKAGTRLKFSKTILCFIEACQAYYNYNVNRNIDFEDFFQHTDLYEENLLSFSLLTDAERTCKKLLQIIRYIVENNLQSTFENTEYDETSEFGLLTDAERTCKKLLQIIRYIVENNLQSTFENTEYDETNRGVDINTSDSLILRTAYKAGDIGWIDYFISKGAKLNGRSDGFEEACKSDKVEVLQHWIKNGGVVPKSPEYPCVNMACLLGSFAMVKLLVESGVDLSNPELNGVRVACRLSLRRTLKYLLDNNAEIKGVRHHQLEYACTIEDVEMLKMILEHYESSGILERKNNTDTEGGKETKDISTLDNLNSDHVKEYKFSKTLLEKGEPIQNIDLLDAVKASVAVANVKIFKMLLTYKLDLNCDSQILSAPIETEKIEIAKLLLENGIDAKNNTRILNMALKTKNAEVIRLLLRNGAKVYKYSHDLKYFDLDDTETLQLMLTCCPEMCGDSPLLEHAIEKNKLGVVKLLLKDVASLNDNEYNYVFWACENDNLEILKLIFEKGAKIREGSESGVIETCENDNLEILKLLLERNPNLVLEKDYGLEAAIEHENMEMVNLLIKHGADTSEYIESIMELADELDCDDLSESCEYNAGGYKKLKRS